MYRETPIINNKDIPGMNDILIGNNEKQYYIAVLQNTCYYSPEKDILLRIVPMDMNNNDKLFSLEFWTRTWKKSGECSFIKATQKVTRWELLNV